METFFCCNGVHLAKIFKICRPFFNIMRKKVNIIKIVSMIKKQGKLPYGATTCTLVIVMHFSVHFFKTRDDKQISNNF